MENNSDFYLILLRFGKGNLKDGFVLQDLVDHMNKNGFPKLTTYSIILTRYFYKVFFSDTQNMNVYPTGHADRFHLRPECYMQLLEFDNMMASRKEAKQARLYALIAISITFISLLITILKK